MKQVEKPTLMGNVKRILCILTSILPFAQNKEAGHCAFEPRRRTSLSEDRP